MSKRLTGGLLGRVLCALGIHMVRVVGRYDRGDGPERLVPTCWRCGKEWPDQVEPEEWFGAYTSWEPWAVYSPEQLALIEIGFEAGWKTRDGQKVGR